MQIYKRIILFILITFTASLGYGQIIMELDTPSSSAKIFAPEIVSTKQKERDIAISPDGKEIYYTIFQNGFDGNIFFIKKVDGVWSVPQIASFSGNGADLEPAFAANGNRLYFASTRNANNYNIWYVERAENGSWSSPIDVGSPVNTSANEFYPSIANDGSIYYTAEYSNGIGGEDIWYAQYLDGEYQTPIALPELNTEMDEFNAFVDPDERFIYFGSFGRSDGLGGGDIYKSTRSGDSWRAGINLGSSVNSKDLDYCPFISPDGKYLFFTSQRSTSSPNRSKNPFDLAAITNSILHPSGTGSDIYWKKK